MPGPATKALRTGAVMGLSALLLSSCGLFPPAAGTEEGTPPPAESHHSEDDHPHDEFYEGIPDVTWAPETDTEVEAIATEVIGLFARPEVPERRWYTDLLPHLSAEYAEDAQYIDPANVRVNDVVSGPALVREKGNPLTVTAEFSTNAGPWSVLLHRVGQDDPWLVEAIEPTNEPANP